MCVWMIAEDENLKKVFPDRYQATPVLVSARATN